MRPLPVLCLALASCQTAGPVRHRFDAPADQVSAATRAALEELGLTEVEDGVLTTYWLQDEAAREGWSGTGQVVHSQSRYRVTIEGALILVEARTRFFVRRGPLRRDWEDVDAAPATARLIERIKARLR